MITVAPALPLRVKLIGCLWPMNADWRPTNECHVGALIDFDPENGISVTPMDYDAEDLRSFLPPITFDPGLTARDFVEFLTTLRPQKGAAR